MVGMPHLIVSDYINYPGTKTSCSCRFGRNQVRFELWVSQIFLFYYSQTGLRDVFLVIGHQGLQEIIHLIDIKSQILGLRFVRDT